MALTIANNIPALRVRINLNNAQATLGNSLERLSSGLKINKASDDAAGLGISENLRADIRSLAQARRNANDAISLSQMAEGAMNVMQGIVTRMRELAVQSANGTLGTTERGYIQTEFAELVQEVDRISATTDYNGQKLINGAAVSGLGMQIGIHTTTNDRIFLSIATVVASTLGSSSGMTLGSASLSTVSNSLNAIATIDQAIQDLSTSRAAIGAFQNRIVATVDNLLVAHENLSAANSRIRDVDVAMESGELAKNQILTQAATSMLAQANGLASNALSLLQG